ncbi:MAG TPA: VOC family protein, partial [Actinomycetota bacterium]|nr:VOC family protein [Actinomycetota bacterium]
AAGSDAMGGAIGRRGESAPDRMRTYVLVNSIEEVLPRVADLGGRVSAERTEVPGQGWFAVLEDSEGNEIAIWESANRG